MNETTIGGYEVLAKHGVSKRFQSFRASRRTSEGVRGGTLYLMTDEVGHPDLFIETVDAIRNAWPFAGGSNRDLVLPKAQLWSGKPWFFLPDLLPVAASVSVLGRAAFTALRAQLSWLEQFQPPGGEQHFAHGDVRKERIALFEAEQPLLIAPGWVAASDYARGRSLTHARGDDAWHLGKLWIQESDRSFVPEGMQPDLNEAKRRLPLARLAERAEASHAAITQPPPARDAIGDGAAREDASITVPPPAREAAAVTQPPPARDAVAARPAAPAREARPAAPAREAAPARPAAARRDAHPFREPAAAQRDVHPFHDAAAPRDQHPFREAASARPAATAVASPPPAPPRSPAAPPVRPVSPFARDARSNPAPPASEATPAFVQPPPIPITAAAHSPAAHSPPARAARASSTDDVSGLGEWHPERNGAPPLPASPAAPPVERPPARPAISSHQPLPPLPPEAKAEALAQPEPALARSMPAQAPAPPEPSAAAPVAKASSSKALWIAILVGFVLAAVAAAFLLRR
jgi:hypothetical protein